jgi:hypothetical protein
MECNDIQEKLSAYIEGIISPEEKMLVDEHLMSCQKCNESLSDLRKTVEYIHNLEDVEPPSWLTQKIMTMVKAEIQPKKSFIQKLFYPLYIKLPIEAVAVVLIAVTALYIFKTNQPEVRLAKAPTEEVTPQIPLQEKDALQKDLKSKENVIPPPPSTSRRPLEKGAKERFEAEQAPPSKKPESMGKLEEAPKAPAPVVTQEEIRPSTGAIARDELKTEALSSAPRAKALAERKEESISFTIHVKDIETAGKEIEKALTQLGGKIIKTESFDDKHVITAELDSKNMKDLFEKLKLIGEVKGKETDFKVLEGDITITIEIVK